MLRMTAAIAAKRLVLAPRPASAASRGRDSAAVRRYRLARLKVEGERRPGDPTHVHLKRIYD
ncbi:hypothetical protein DSM104329_02645 [Capillimicrobium parvum]|uniref:Uncharacterized protein n=2 Tax=Capillimicrobium parvum TaxID=2884022 RepID=A0A9E6XXH5_9ACTN|nr:hypothetical protein DSM104329_02645 [Capillimicrobium parvum]